MRLSSRVAGLALPAVIAAMLPTVAAESAGAVPMCQGHRATIVGSPTDVELHGTNGDDVIVTRGAAAVVAKRGSDRICVTGTNRRDGGTNIDAGPGDDRVQVKTSRTGQLEAHLGDGDDRMVVTTTPARRILAYLDAGKDVYRGGSGRDFVYAEHRDYYDPAPVDDVDRISSGGGSDRVDVGVGHVTQHVTHDVLDLGGGDDALNVRGVLAPDVRPEGGAGSDSLRMGNASYCASPSDPGCTERRDWVVDNTLEVGTVDGVVQSRWSGFEGFSLMDLTEGSVSFIGSDVDETVTARRLIGATMGPGDDSLSVNTVNEGQQQDFSGGPGRDTIDARGWHLTVDLSAGELWEHPWQGSPDPPSAHVHFNEFENASGTGEDWVNLIGDDGDNILWGFSCYVTEAGGPGDDVLTTAPDNTFGLCDYYQPGVIFDGGAGADVLRGGLGPDDLDGGEGRDTAYGSKGTDVCLAEVRYACEQ